MDSPGRMRVLFFLSAQGGLPSNETTMAEVLKDNGYATALTGKWHLGITCTEKNSCSDPNSQGFDYFYGLPVTNLLDCGNESTIFHAWARAKGAYPKMWFSVIAAFTAAVFLYMIKVVSWKGAFSLTLLALASNGLLLLAAKTPSLGCVLMENSRIVEQPLLFDHLTERLHSRAIHFMESNRHQPFLLIMSFVQAHTVLFNDDRFRNHSVHGRYGDNLEEMDWSVGEVLRSLKNLGLENNTFVYLTSDNGGHVEEFTDDEERHGGWNGIYKGGKGSTWEGGIRVPTVVKLPGVIPAGTVVSQPTHLPDILPTVARVTGVTLPTDRLYDGRDLMPLLISNDSSEVVHEFMFHYCAGFLNAVRYTPKGTNTTYKLHYRTTRLVPGTHGIVGCFDTFLCQCAGNSVVYHDPPLVYDLTKDPSETSPLDSNDPKVRGIIGKVAKAVSHHQGGLPSRSGPWSAWLNMFPRPWGVPWCGSFPHYTCVDPYLEKFQSVREH
ncbi:steryl-sulfatase-like isoform X2 [Acanthaster planci]|nr:steryl-sulfatase-like isoform X2 [Acanthaster planci]